MKHTDAWFVVNADRCKAILDFLDDPTDAAREAMHDACAVRQPPLFDADAH